MNVVEEKIVDQYVQELSALSLSSLQISSLVDNTRKRFDKFRFHKPQKRKSKTEECKVDSGSEANAITMKKYKELYPDRFDENGVPDHLHMEDRKYHTMAQSTYQWNMPARSLCAGSSCVILKDRCFLVNADL